MSHRVNFSGKSLFVWIFCSSFEILFVRSGREPRKFSIYSPVENPGGWVVWNLAKFYSILIKLRKAQNLSHNAYIEKKSGNLWMFQSTYSVYVQRISLLHTWPFLKMISWTLLDHQNDLLEVDVNNPPLHRFNSLCILKPLAIVICFIRWNLSIWCVFKLDNKINSIDYSNILCGKFVLREYRTLKISYPLHNILPNKVFSSLSWIYVFEV